MSRYLFISWVIAVGIGMTATPAAAQSTATDTFVVSITLQNQCTVQVDDLNLGTVDTLTPAHGGTVNGTAVCTAIAPVAISFDVGTGGGTLAERTLVRSGGAETVTFNLYRDAAFTEILGSGTSGTFTIGFTSTGGTDTFPVYAQTAPNQNPKPLGTYQSTITATITY